MALILEKLNLLHTVLSYEQYGNYTKLKEILDRVDFSPISKDKYFFHNIFQSLWMSGLINVSWESGSIRWAYNQEEIFIPRDADTLVVSKGEDLTSGSGKGFIYHNDEIPISFVRHTDVISEAIKWNAEVFLRFVSYAKVLDAGLEKVSLSSLGALEGSYFNFSDFCWMKQEAVNFSRSGLIKVFHERRGFSFYIFDVVTGFTYRVVEVEWIFLFAMSILNLDFKKIFKYSEDRTLSVPGAIRLPVLIARFLVSISSRIRLGDRIIFYDINPDAVSSLLTYLNQEDYHG